MAAELYNRWIRGSTLRWLLVRWVVMAVFQLIVFRCLHGTRLRLCFPFLRSLEMTTCVLASLPDCEAVSDRLGAVVWDAARS